MEDEVKDFVNMMLEDESFDDFLERFNISPDEVFFILVESGHVDEELVKEMMGL